MHGYVSNLHIGQSSQKTSRLLIIKDFVQSSKYKEAISEIRDTIRQILSNTEKASDNFNAVNLENSYTELGNCDFNDSYYLELARMNNWKIVSDNADLFKNNKLNIEIITANLKWRLAIFVSAIL